MNGQTSVHFLSENENSMALVKSENTEVQLRNKTNTMNDFICIPKLSLNGKANCSCHSVMLAVY